MITNFLSLYALFGLFINYRKNKTISTPHSPLIFHSILYLSILVNNISVRPFIYSPIGSSKDFIMKLKHKRLHTPRTIASLSMHF